MLINSNQNTHAEQDWFYNNMPSYYICNCVIVYVTVFLGHIFSRSINMTVCFQDWKLCSQMHTCLGMLLPEDLYGSASDVLLVCAGFWLHSLTGMPAGTKTKTSQGQAARIGFFCLTVSTMPPSKRGFSQVRIVCGVDTCKLVYFCVSQLTNGSCNTVCISITHLSPPALGIAPLASHERARSHLKCEISA